MGQENLTVEQIVVSELKEYKRLIGNIKMLERQPIGYGMHVYAAPGEDKLQALHKKLKDHPSYMYLSPKEQEIELVAHTHLENYPTGTRSQRNEVKSTRTNDTEDNKILAKLGKKIDKVIDARRGTLDGFEAVVQKVSELQDLNQRKEQIDATLEILSGYNPEYALLLKTRYIEGKTVGEVASEFGISRRTFDRFREQAITEYIRFAGMAQS